ncbi:hypothetical protein JCM18918_4079 [Cutibacterium acnes JCM 18918]|nr:hypothetical protein JCM18918_4079 [Cutibacterium acnes JCM 18918]
MVATLIAIAVSVGFLVGISMFVRTQGVALGKEQAVATSKADVVVDTGGAVADPDEVTRTIKETQGVAAVDTVLSTSMPAAHGHDSVMIDLHQVPAEPSAGRRSRTGPGRRRPTRSLCPKMLPSDSRPASAIPLRSAVMTSRWSASPTTPRLCKLLRLMWPTSRPNPRYLGRQGQGWDGAGTTRHQPREDPAED